MTRVAYTKDAAGTSDDPALPELRKIAKEIASIAFDLLYKDSHYYGTRPCQTCNTASNLMGFDIGCERYRKEKR